MFLAVVLTTASLIFSLIYLVVTFISLHRCCSTRGGHLGAGRETTTGETATRQAPAEGPLLPQAPPDAHAAREGVGTADARQHAPRRRDATSSRAREATSAQAAEVGDEDTTAAVQAEHSHQQPPQY